MTAFQHQQRLAVVTVAAYNLPPTSSRCLLESCRRQGICIELLGKGRPYKNNYDKTEIVAEYLEAHPEWHYVLFVDFRDCIFCGCLRELFWKFQRLGKSVVCAAERIAWPIASHAQLAPPTGTSFRYLNSGTILATRAAWLDAWSWMQRRRQALAGTQLEVGASGLTIFDDDQAAWSDYYLHGDGDVALDARCDMFQALATIESNVAAANRDLLLEGRRVVNRETRGRPCIIHANGGAWVHAWGNYVLQSAPAWNGPLIQRLRTAPVDMLRDEHRLMGLLLELGLHSSHDEYVEEELLPFCGKGLSIWQQPREFANYLIWLSERPPIHSYLEIGVADGGAFITTVEYLRRFHPLQHALAVDPQPSPAVSDYAGRTPGVEYIRGTVVSSDVEHFARSIGGFDLILIDGDHTARGCWTDWQFAQRHGRYVALHDTASFPGVMALWREITCSFVATRDFTDRELYKPWGLGIVDLAAGRRPMHAATPARPTA